MRVTTKRRQAVDDGAFLIGSFSCASKTMSDQMGKILDDNHLRRLPCSIGKGHANALRFRGQGEQLHLNTQSIPAYKNLSVVTALQFGFQLGFVDVEIKVRDYQLRD